MMQLPWDRRREKLWEIKLKWWNSGERREKRKLGFAVKHTPGQDNGKYPSVRKIILGQDGIQGKG